MARTSGGRSIRPSVVAGHPAGASQSRQWCRQPRGTAATSVIPLSERSKCSASTRMPPFGRAAHHADRGGEARHGGPGHELARPGQHPGALVGAEAGGGAEAARHDLAA